MTETRYPSVGRILQRHLFKRWLLRHEAGETVGIANSLYACPLATYVRDTLDLTDREKIVRVGADVQITPRGHITALPIWAADFRTAVDRRVEGKGWAGRQPPVTREQALAILEGGDPQ